MKYLSINREMVSADVPTSLEAGRLLPIAALLAAALLWGSSFPAMRVSVQAMSPWTVMWLRMVIALSAILPFAGRMKPSAYRKGDWRMLLPTVLLQPCLYFLLEAYALRFTTSSQAGVISASVPLMVAVGAWLMLAEPLGRKTFAGLFLSVAGVTVLSLAGRADASAADPLLGNLLELCAMISAAMSIIFVKRLCDRYNPWLLTMLQLVAGTLFFSPGLILLFRQAPMMWTAPLVFSILLLAVVSVGAFGLYNWAMSRIPASRASAFINLVPVAAVAFGWMILGEALSGVQCVAAASVIVGVAISQKGA